MRIVILGAVLGIMVVVGVWYYTQSPQDNSITEEKPRIIDPSENLAAQFSSVHVVGRKAGRKQYELTFDIIEQIDDKNPFTVFSNLVDGRIYDDDGQLRYQVEAGWGKWYQSTDDLELAQGVTLRTADDEVVTAPAFTWKAADETLLSNGQVTIRTLTSSIEADHMTAHMAKDEVYLKDNVRIVDDSGFTLAGQKAIYRQKHEMVEVFGPAQIEVSIGGGKDANMVAENS